MLTLTSILLRLVTFLSDAFLAERDVHCVRDVDIWSVMHAFGACGTHRITYHSAAASLITCLQNIVIYDTIIKKRGVYYV